MTTRLILAALLVLLAVPAQSKPLEDYEWVEVATDEFRIRSIRGERATLKYARELALLLKVVPGELQFLRHKDTGPVTVYILRYPSQVEELLHDDRPWYYVDPWYHNVPAERSLVIGTFTGTRRSIDYVFARYLFGGGLVGDPLHWWQEGLTEYFRYTGISRGYYYFGSSAAKRVESPEAIRVAMDLVTTPATSAQLTAGDRRAHRYYSHRLVRYLMDNRESWRDLVLRLQHYVDMVNDGAEYRLAFELAFDISMDELAQKVSEHGRICCSRYKVALEDLEGEFDPQVRVLDRDTIKAALDEISASARRALPNADQ